ncbi:ankyrin repeat domain-containing protein [Wolbachia endosymbiont of Ctenocephalides felis wCfeT]|uniref:ankyrin repeat domain-containing protein n=1 Tax=Wolbachia endosymbiont of Ctenocephalides felis wCfeT TaxID=2732593 RepID=UPI0014459EBA|nr:ankyrin repeat domain-containing protein [Wolbachia endosymbiont of Ctenocephalides felis wCfeT]
MQQSPIEQKNIEFIKLLIENEKETHILREAIKQGNLKRVKFLVEHSANVNEKYEHNRTPLHIAIGFKRLEIAKFLIEKGADVNAKIEHHGKDDLTPMHLAVFAKTTEFLELLINNNALINERESIEGHTPLHLAALYGNTSVLQALVGKGQNIEDVDNNGRIALFLALRQCTEQKNDSRVEVIEYLINKLKADVTKKDNNNNTVLFFAANNCPGKVVELIIKKFKENFGEGKLKDFFHHKNVDGVDALDIALNSGNEEVIKVLRSYGADIENKVNGESRLFRSVKENDTRKVELLLENGAFADTADDYDTTPIYFAIRNGNIDINNLLLKYNASVNLNEKEYGLSPLHTAALNNRKEIAHVLLKNGANLYAQTNNGMDVIDISEEQSLIQLYLKDAGLALII